MKNNRAFTLAEVLITLTIIGVIAVLTIPNLMQSYRKHQIEVGIKEAYSIISNALTMAKAEYGNEIYDTMPDSSNPNAISTEQWINSYIAPYLKIEKDFGNINIKAKYYKSGYGAGSIAPRDGYIRFLQLTNGMNLLIYRGYYQGTVFIMDVDGFNGKNIFGVDLFGFTMFYIDSYHRFIGGFTHGEWGHMSQKTSTECNSGTRNMCAYRIQRNSWKIPDDYPVKKW